MGEVNAKQKDCCGDWIRATSPRISEAWRVHLAPEKLKETRVISGSWTCTWQERTHCWAPASASETRHTNRARDGVAAVVIHRELTTRWFSTAPAEGRLPDGGPWSSRGLQGAASQPCSIYPLSYETAMKPAMLQGCSAEKGEHLVGQGRTLTLPLNCREILIPN